MSKPRRQAKRIIRELTPAEQMRLKVARSETEAKKEQILAQGKSAKAAWVATQREVRQAVDSLRARRQKLGLSLADVEQRSGFAVRCCLGWKVIRIAIQPY